MKIVAAFLWNKSPRCTISSMIFDYQKMDIISKPEIVYLPKGYLSFRHHASKTIKIFFQKIKSLNKITKAPVIIEYRIVFYAHMIPYLKPAKESKYVYQMFTKQLNKTQKKFKALHVQSQLRNKLTGKNLKRFKKTLRDLHLVSRKRNTGFEYHLWTVALHATTSTYENILKQVKNKLLKKMYEDF